MPLSEPRFFKLLGLNGNKKGIDNAQHYQSL